VIACGGAFIVLLVLVDERECAFPFLRVIGERGALLSVRVGWVRLHTVGARPPSGAVAHVFVCAHASHLAPIVTGGEKARYVLATVLLAYLAITTFCSICCQRRIGCVLPEIGDS